MYLGPQFQLANGIVRFNIFITHLTHPPITQETWCIFYFNFNKNTDMCLFQIASGALLK